MNWNNAEQAIAVTTMLLWCYWGARLLRSAVNFLDQWAKPPAINIIHHK
jgi:hypothetical protein